MKSFVLAIALAMPAVALADPASPTAPGGPQSATVSTAPLAQWDQLHPDGATALGEWVQSHPTAAARVFSWDAQHPLRTRAFIEWAASHPGQPLDAFFQLHPKWPVVKLLLVPERPAIEALMAWCQAHGAAATELMARPRGLEWAGKHLYADSWKPLAAKPAEAPAVTQGSIEPQGSVAPQLP